MVVLDISGDISDALEDKIYKGVSEEDRREKIKRLHKGEIRGDPKEGDEVLFTAYKIIVDEENDKNNKTGTSYVILTNRERHFKKEN
jgi:hypothetical protein